MTENADKKGVERTPLPCLPFLILVMVLGMGLGWALLGD